MAGANVLSDEALAQVRDVVRQVLGSLRGAQPLPRPPIAQGPEVFIAKPSTAIPARSGTTPGELESVPLYKIDRETPVIEALLLQDGYTANDRTLYSLALSEIDPEFLITLRTKLGTWLAIPEARHLIRRCCLAENHPGCGVAFDLKLGTWNPSTDSWDYEASASAKGIDYWYSVAGPYPNSGATGNFIARPSDTYGVIWECVGNMSCDSDSCGGCGA